MSYIEKGNALKINGKIQAVRDRKKLCTTGIENQFLDRTVCVAQNYRLKQIIFN